MRSQPAGAARHSVSKDVSRMTPEQRLAAFLAMKPIAAMLIVVPILAGCEPTPWLRDLFQPSSNQYRAAEGQEVIIVLVQHNARVGGCVIDSSKAGITLMGRYLDSSADNQKMFLTADDIQAVTIIYEGRCKAEK